MAEWLIKLSYSHSHSQVCSLDSEQANEIALHQIKIASMAQPRKHSIVTRPFSTLRYNIHLFRSKM